MVRKAAKKRSPRRDPPEALPDLALERAQDLVYDAWDAGDPRRKMELAKEALRISPLCADAYVVLAQHAARSDQQLDLWRRGVEAGTAAIGAAFDECVGHFWGVFETRPYMRARYGLASALWERGARAEAIDHLRDMLRLCPGDNLGVRYVLSAWLIDAGRDDDLAALFDTYRGDGGAGWSWTKALAAFRRGGDGAKSRAALEKAVQANGHVAAYLIGTKRLPRSRPPYVSPGDDDEAVDYAARCTAGWRNTPGAIEWLRERTGAAKSKKAAARKPAARRGNGGKTVH